MAIACTRDTFATAGACFKNLTLHDRKAAMVWLKALELEALGGTAYTLGPDGTLQAAAICFDELSGLEMGAWYAGIPYLVIQADVAETAGATVPTDINEVAVEIECLKNFSERKLQSMDLLLTCELSNL